VAEDELADLRTRVEALESRRRIAVERIDVVESDGTVRMVLSNSALAPDPVVDGQTFTRDSGNTAGIVFYNDVGDECGGLVYKGRRRDDGYSAGGALLFDQFKQDQVLGIMHDDTDGRRRAGLWVWDRPDEPFPSHGGATRLFAGKAVDGSVTVELRDKAGRVRLRMAVSADGDPQVELLDESGDVTARLPN
jgi:hypothetical protein